MGFVECAHGNARQVMMRSAFREVQLQNRKEKSPGRRGSGQSSGVNHQWVSSTYDVVKWSHVAIGSCGDEDGRQGICWPA